MNFEATPRFILRFDSSGWLRLLSISKSSRNLVSFHLLVASVSRSASLPGSSAPLIQNGLTRFRRFSRLCHADIASDHDTVQGCPFQVTGERTAFLSFRQVLLLEMQFHYLYPGINTAIRFVFIASWFLKDSSGLLASFIGSV